MGGPTGVFIKNRIVVSIKPDQPATFHDSVDWMYQVACFLSMAAGRAQGIDHIHVTTTEVIDDIPQSLTIRPSYRWKASDKSEKHKPHPGDVPLDPIQHRAEFDAVLADWIGRHSGRRVARSRYLDCMRKANKYGPERTFPSNPDASSKETIIQDIHSCPDTPHPGAVSETRPGKQLPLVMRWARDERCLSQACQAVLEFMQRHPIATTWGRSDLASSDMMSMETSKRVWQARLDPRRNTSSVGIYSHVLDRWGIFHAQPFVLNERQAGVAIEGVIRQERLETSQLAVDTHGYTDFAMALARLLGFDLCPRLKELKQRHLFVPRGTKVPAEIAAVCEATVDTALIEKHWDSLVHLSASVMSGHASAVAALASQGVTITGTDG